MCSLISQCSQQWLCIAKKKIIKMKKELEKKISKVLYSGFAW
jgi:hypothetical protein